MIRNLFAKDDARTVIHVALCAVMGWLGAVLMLPGDTFATSQTFAVMAEIATEQHWALVFWFVATVGLIGLTSVCRGIALCSILMVATMHGIVAICFVVANPITTGTGTYAVIALLGYYLVWGRANERA